DVRAVVAEERRLHPDAVAPRAEQLLQNATPLPLVPLPGGGQGLADVPRPVPGADEGPGERGVRLPPQRLVAAAPAHAPPPGCPPGRLFATSPSMTSDQPLKIMSIPTNRPMTHSPDTGHCRQMRTPRSTLIAPCNSNQTRFW